VVFGENSANRGGGVCTKRMKLAKEQQTEDLVHFGARKNHIMNWGVTCALRRPKIGRSFNLHTQVRRCVQETPPTWNGAPSKLSLRARRTLEAALAHTEAVHTATIPLWEAATRRAAQYFDPHLRAVERRALQQCANPSDFTNSER